MSTHIGMTPGSDARVHAGGLILALAMFPSESIILQLHFKDESLRPRPHGNDDLGAPEMLFFEKQVPEWKNFLKAL